MLAPLTASLILAGGLVAGEPAIPLRSGDRIVLLGDTLIEREQAHGYLETALLSRHPGRRLRFRNLGWSADTTAGLSRVYFDSPEKGRERLYEQATGQGPTVLLVGYGMAESLENPDLAETFAERMEQLLGAIAKGGERVVLLSPIRHEAKDPPYPDPGSHNAVLARYADSLRVLANVRGHSFVDLFERLPQIRDTYSMPPLADNGIHLNELGYWLLALEFQQALGMRGEPVTAHLDASGKVLSREGCVISNVRANDGTLEFDQLDACLPTCVEGIPREALRLPGVVSLALRVTGLSSGTYALKIDDVEITRADARTWQVGVPLWNTPQHSRAERARALVQRKNRLFFERYRPQNITYLLLFRSYEQGQNAKEIEALDGIIEAAENEIDAAVQPVTHRFCLTREN